MTLQRPWWMTFREGPPVCVEASSAANAIKLTESETGRTVIGCEILPHPAEPRIVVAEHPAYGVLPSICRNPMRCRGRTECPLRPVTCVGDKP